MEELSLQETWWEWFEARAHGTHALSWLALVSFLEPIFLPLMPEVVMAPLILARREHWKTYVVITAAASALGGVAGYFLGVFFFSTFGPLLLAHWGLSRWFHIAKHRLSRHVFLFMFLLMFSPAPDKAFVVLAGFFHVPFLPYVIGFTLGRLLRFSTVGYLVHRFGAHVLGLAREYFEWFAVVALLLTVLVMLRFFHFF